MGGRTFGDLPGKKSKKNRKNIIYRSDSMSKNNLRWKQIFLFDFLSCYFGWVDEVWGSSNFFLKKKVTSRI